MWQLEQFSIGCCETNTKVITSTNHSRWKQRNELIVSVKDVIGFGFPSHW